MLPGAACDGNVTRTALEKAAGGDIGTRLCAMLLLDFEARGTQALAEQLVASANFPRVDVAFLRSDWSNDGVWVGLKGGDNSLTQIGKGTTHTHADQGSFVLDMLGERWQKISAATLTTTEVTLPSRSLTGTRRQQGDSTR